MKRSFVFMTALMLSALAFLPSQAAEEMTATYIAGPGGRISSTEVPVGFGGYAFPAGMKPVSVVVEDFVGSDIFVEICQNFAATPDDVICGDGQEPDVQTCSDGSPIKLTPDFSADFATTVFVLTADSGGACEGNAVAGMITMTFK